MFRFPLQFPDRFRQFVQIGIATRCRICSSFCSQFLREYFAFLYRVLRYTVFWCDVERRERALPSQKPGDEIKVDPNAVWEIWVPILSPTGYHVNDYALSWPSDWSLEGLHYIIWIFEMDRKDFDIRAKDLFWSVQYFGDFWRCWSNRKVFHLKSIFCLNRFRYILVY